MTVDSSQQAKLVRQLGLFRERLLDIDARNPSLRLRRETQDRYFDLAKLGPGTVNAVYTRLSRAGAPTRLVSETDESLEGVKSRQQLRKVWRTAEARTEETGLKELYLGVCWLTGHLDPTTFVRGPLFVVPAALELRRDGRSPGWHLSLTAQELMVNEAMLAAIRKHRDVRLADDMDELAVQALSTLADDPEFKASAGPAFFSSLSRVAVESGVRAEIAPYEITPLLPQTNRDLGDEPQPLRLQSHLVVGMFPQSSTALYADMETMIARAVGGETDQGIVDNLLEAAADPENEGSADRVELDEVSETKVQTVLPTDPSQFAVLVKAQSSECLVVRGPPGTGKSQVIVNLVADGLARGKCVLVVCQKRPAIDVVYERLEAEKLGVSASVIHDAVADRATLYKKLHTLLQKSAPSSPPRGKSYQNLGSEIDDLVRRIRAITEPLASEVRGVPLYELYRRARSGFRPIIELPDAWTSQSLTELADTLSAIEQAKPGVLRFDQPEHPLALRGDFSRLGHVERLRALQLFQALLDAARAGAGVVLRAREAAPVLRRALAVYERLERRWYRFAVPAWWFALRRIRTFTSDFATSPVHAWKALLDHGERLAGILSDLNIAMSPPWQAAMLEHLAEPKRLADFSGSGLQSFQQEFETIAQHDRIRCRLSAVESDLLARCAQSLSPDIAWDEHLQQELILRWIDETEARNPVLRGSPFDEYEQLRSALERKLIEKRQSVARHLAHALRERALTPTPPPTDPSTGDARGTRKPAADWNKLVHELGKQRRIKPIRSLLQEFPWQMRQIVPCWLTSPEVASEIFPLERRYFDMVIFDEASQLPMERALPVLYRASQVVIAGDEQQMPPSRFFMSSLDDEDDPAEIDQAGPLSDGEAKFADSLLAQAKRIYGFDYLAWHYRSRYQELIDFSNHAFYDGTLCVAANVDREPTTPPMRWIDARGTWSENINAVEVRLAVDELARVLQARPDQPASVGIITFNQKQREAIKNEIDDRRGRDAQFALVYDRADNPASGHVDDKPFVKNIENVQGDERDHIIFSIGYGPGPDGVFRRRFGPLSQSGGENRLNVAATRARESVTVICSFDPDTLASEDAKHRGPLLLKRYLQYVHAVARGDRAARERVIAELNTQLRAPSDPRALDFDSPFEERIYGALSNRGYQVETQWGVGGYRIDLAVAHPAEPTRFCLGIECDGATYHSGKSVRERDIARQAFLESRGWTIHRIWSRDYWQNPQRELDRLVARLPRITPSRMPQARPTGLL